LFWGSADVSVLLAKSTLAQQAAATVEAAHVTTVLATETSVQEATMTLDSIALCVKGVEDWATLAQRETLERVSRVKAVKAIVLASARADAKGFV
jgi:hypothetical protein